MAFSAIIPWAARGPATYLPPAELAQGLVAAWQAEARGLTLWRETAELLLAQIIIETNWSRSMWRFNWGNITAGATWPGAVWLPSWYELTPTSSERDRDLHAKMLVGKAPRWFRAYNSHEEGSRDYVRLLLTSPYESMLAAARTGDAPAFAKAVRTRYCPDCESDSFAQGVSTIRDQIRANGWFADLPNAPGLIRETITRSSSDSSGWAAAALGAFVIGGVIATGATVIALSRRRERASGPAPQRTVVPYRPEFRYDRDRRFQWSRG